MNAGNHHSKGLVCVLTGDGKGKTSAAVGMTVRARAAGWDTFLIHFHKDPSENGQEVSLLEKIGSSVFFYAPVHPGFISKKYESKGSLNKRISKEVLEGLVFAETIMSMTKNTGLLVMDEILISVRDGFLKEKRLVSFIEQKPANIYLVMTGRGMTAEIEKKADSVSIIGNRRHHYDSGVPAVKGFEF